MPPLRVVAFGRQQTVLYMHGYMLITAATDHYTPSVIQISQRSYQVPLAITVSATGGKRNGLHEDNTRRALSRRTSLLYPGSLMVHPGVGGSSSGAVPQRSLQPPRGTVHSQQTARSVTSHPDTDTSSNSATSGDDDDDDDCDAHRVTGAVQANVDAGKNPASFPPVTVVAPSTKLLVRKKKATSPAAAETTEAEDAQEDADAGGTSQDKRRKRKRKPRITANLAGTRYEVGE